MNEPVRMMVYSQDSYGLGHLRRTTNIANAMVGQRTDLTVLMTVDSPVAPFFDLNDRIDFIKLPTVVKVDAGKFKAGQLSTGYERVRDLRSNVIRETTLQYRPHLLLVEDVGVKPYQVHRMLVQLRDAGYLSQLQGVVLGDFDDCVQHADQGYTMDEVFADFFAELPVSTGWPVGHADAPHLSLTLGTEARLTVPAEGASRLAIAGPAG